MPPGISNRVFCSMTLKNEAEMLIMNSHIELNSENLRRAVKPGRNIVGQLRHYALHFEPTADGSCKVTGLVCGNPKAGMLVNRLVNTNRISIAYAKGFKGIFNFIRALAMKRQRHDDYVFSHPSPQNILRNKSHNLFQNGKLEAAKSRHRDSPKGFACFLSHHKQACAAQARLVKQQLESMLGARVFLGKCST